MKTVVYICLSSHVSIPRPGHNYHFMSIIKLFMYGSRCSGVKWYTHMYGSRFSGVKFNTQPQSRARLTNEIHSFGHVPSASNEIRFKPLFFFFSQAANIITSLHFLITTIHPFCLRLFPGLVLALATSLTIIVVYIYHNSVCRIIAYCNITLSRYIRCFMC